jgi:MoaA/NifB/PqqE/SkfB family radical SAM enzyme
MKIFREELFGGIIFDTNTLRYRIVDLLKEKVDKIVGLEKIPPRSDIFSSPIRVYFELTRLCNLNCSHCFVSSSNHEYYGLKTNKIFKIIDQLYDFRVLDIRFTGGEPTMRKDWFEILYYAKQLGFCVSLNTNGIYNNIEEMICLFKKINLDQITISIDGMKENHNLIRGQGTFEKSLKTIIEFSKAELPLRINTVINRNNVNDIPDIIKFASKYVKEINFFYTRPVGRAIKQNNFLLSFDEHYESAINTILLRNFYPNLNIMHFEQSFKERSVSFNNEKNYGLVASFPYGNTTFSIASDGSFWPHGYSPYQLKELKLGKFPKNHISEIWYYSKKLDMLRKWYRELMNRCEKCEEYKLHCAGINFEMEIAQIMGVIKKNPYCISNIPIPNFNLGEI